MPFIIILANNNFSLIYPMLQSIWCLKLQLKFLLKKKIQRSFSKICWKYLLVLFIGSFGKPKPVWTNFSFCSDGYVYISVLLVDVYAMHLMLIHISNIYTHTLLFQ